MKSTARVAGHPVHPMLIPYPFALLSAATVFDVIDRQGRGGFGRTAGLLHDAGLLSAVVAAVPGIVDYVGSVPRGTQASRDATWHAMANTSAVIAFVAARRQLGEDGVISTRGLGYALLGTALMSMGGLLGSTLVYHHHIGVDDESPPAVSDRTRPPAALNQRSAEGHTSGVSPS